MNKFRLKMTAIAATLAVMNIVGSETSDRATPIPPDEWHCDVVSPNGEQLCMHLNQFLGWWTGFNTEFRVPNVRNTEYVKLYWNSTLAQGGRFPANGSSFRLNSNEVGRGDSWADLPSFACVTVRAYVLVSYSHQYESNPLTVCRNN